MKLFSLRRRQQGRARSVPTNRVQQRMAARWPWRPFEGPDIRLHATGARQSPVLGRRDVKGKQERRFSARRAFEEALVD